MTTNIQYGGNIFCLIINAVKLLEKLKEKEILAKKLFRYSLIIAIFISTIYTINVYSRKPEIKKQKKLFPL